MAADSPFAWTAVSGYTNGTAGYLPTLLLNAILANDRENVTSLEGFLKRFEALLGGGDISPLQRDQVELQLLQGRSTVLQDEQNKGLAFVNALESSLTKLTM